MIKVLTLSLIVDMAKNNEPSYSDQLVLENEGSFKGKKWVFNSECSDYSPFILDVGTINILYQAYHKISEENQKMFVEKILLNRNMFVKYCNMLWGHSSFKHNK